MSIPMSFFFFDEHGNYLESSTLYTISYGQNPGDLDDIKKEISGIDFDKYQRIHPDVRYASPLSAPNYMFDLHDPSQILPNKFKGN